MPYRLVPETPLAWFVYFVFRLLFRFRAYGGEDLDEKGPVLLIPNHVSWIDFLFLGVCLKQDWRFVTSATTAEASWVHRRIMRSKRAFPIDTTSPYAIKQIAAYLKSGGRLVLFAEGRITTTGSLMKLYEGSGFLLLRSHAKVITCYIRGGNRSKLSKQKGWTEWFPRVSLHFSRAQEPPARIYSSNIAERKHLTSWLRDSLVKQQFNIETEFGDKTVLDAIVSNRYRQPKLSVLGDVTYKELSYDKVVVGAEVLSQQWSHTLGDDDQRIGLLLPNVNATPVTLLSLWAAKKVPALLNYSSGPSTMLACCRLASIKTVLTSRLFLERARLDLSEMEEAGLRILYLEDIRSNITAKQKLSILFKQRIRRPFQSLATDPNSVAAILFTSGSEGVPKGVELTHANLIANIRQMLAVIDITDQDRVFNALPMFHSFGLTIGTLLPLVRGLFVFLYPSPLHYRMVPALVYDQDCSILLGTNTFLNGYARKAHTYDFHTLRYLFAGAEKTQASTFEAWAYKYGIRILEGYGATECSPCISVNTRMEAKVGSAGRLLPTIEHRLEKVPGVDQGGRLFVRGPNVMKGYLNEEANQAFQSLKGWYDTGDIADIDLEGFVHILGRLKRFAKISGEMVSLTAIEESLSGQFQHLGLRAEVAILAEPDDRKGEKLIAIVNHAEITLEAIRDVLNETGHSNLSVPRQLEFVQTIPKLGSGKIDYRSLQQTLTEQSESAGQTK